jgi:hypothetical protein
VRLPQRERVHRGAVADQDEVGLGDAGDRVRGVLPQRQDHRTDAEGAVGDEELVDVLGVVGGRGRDEAHQRASFAGQLDDVAIEIGGGPQGRRGEPATAHRDDVSGHAAILA